MPKPKAQNGGNRIMGLPLKSASLTWLHPKETDGGGGGVGLGRGRQEEKEEVWKEGDRQGGWVGCNDHGTQPSGRTGVSIG